MGKIITTLVVVIAAFMLAVVIPMAASGNLNKESIDKILGREVLLEPNEPDPASTLLQSLNEERERLTAWDADLKKRENLLALREADLSSTVKEVQAMQEQINSSMDTLDEEAMAGIEEVAKTLGTMKPDNAAKDLEAMTPEQAAKLLPLIEERSRGKILDAMEDLQHRSLILQIMQETKY
jgi:flagellar motility protein MotE (MotC chaperone)